MLVTRAQAGIGTLCGWGRYAEYHECSVWREALTTLKATTFSASLQGVRRSGWRNRR